MNLSVLVASYIGLGLATLAGMLLTSREERKRAKRAQEWRMGLGIVGKSEPQLSERAAALLTGLAIVFAWPAALVFATRHLFKRIRRASGPDSDSGTTGEKVYAGFIEENRQSIPTNRIRVVREHLGRKTSIEEIEKQWSVLDPAGGLEAAIPFGWRSKSWAKFADLFMRQRAATLWTFEVHNSKVWELRHRVVKGVVIDREGVLVDYYLIEIEQKKEDWFGF